MTVSACFDCGSRSDSPGSLENHATTISPTSSMCNFGGMGINYVPQPTEDDAFLAKELNKLSMEEREQLFEELHGVNEIVQEDPTFVAGRIQALKKELSKYSVTKRRAYDRATFLCPGLENDEKLFLMFLRGERFNHVEAAAKLCSHFEHKLELFGEAKLPKKITLEDLDKDDLDCFPVGSYAILPKKDRSGRAISFIHLNRMKYKHWKNQVRYSWYHVFNILLDEETQKNGVIDILYFVGMNGIPDNLLEYVRDSHHILSAFPVRSSGFHICYNSEFVRPFLSFLHLVTTKQRRMRERMHFGSHLEVSYALCTFGISFSELPYDDNEANFQRYIEQLLESRRSIEDEEKRAREKEEARTGRIAHPSPVDVLCGRGRPYQDFEGNLRVGKIVDDHVPLYIATQERATKTTIAVEIVQKVKNAGGRFLLRQDDGWEIADDKIARAKISQALRVRALKKIRGEGCEPAPIKGDSPTGHQANSREYKRRRFSPDEQLQEVPSLPFGAWAPAS